MPSEVDIANLALAHLGDTATITSLWPAEGSPQAQHAAMFYPMARDAMIEMHNWDFATKRVALTPTTNIWTEWDYAYICPPDLVFVLAVLPVNATDDLSVAVNPTTANEWPIYPADMYVDGISAVAYSPQPYSREVDALGNQIILTDQENATLRYTARIKDPSKFSPLFTLALSWYLASMLAGPLIKGDAGMAMAQQCTQMAQLYIGKATTVDANQRRTNLQRNVDWLVGR